MQRKQVILALPYKNWLDLKEKLVKTFAAVAKGERVIYVDGTATPRLAQYLLIELLEDRVVFHFRNTGDFPGYSTKDIPAPYTVWLSK